MADITNRTINQVERPQLAGAKGIALLASMALGYIPSFEDIKKHVKIENRFVPNPQNRKLYDDRFREFKTDLPAEPEDVRPAERIRQKSLSTMSAENLEDYCAPGTTVRDEMVRVTPQVSLRVITFTPPQASTQPAIVFVAGWISLMRGWKNVLREMTKDFTVYYVETTGKDFVAHRGKDGIWRGRNRERPRSVWLSRWD